MFKFFRTRNPLNEVQSLRDRAERVATNHLEAQAVANKISRPMVQQYARALNMHPGELIERIPDRRSASRHAKAMKALRDTGLATDREGYDDSYFNQ